MARPGFPSEKLYRAGGCFSMAAAQPQTRGSQRDKAHFPSGEGKCLYPWTRHGRIVQVMTERDMAVIISLTGESEATVSLAQELAETGAHLSLPGWQYTSVCDENLYIHSITPAGRMPEGLNMRYPPPILSWDRISVSGVPGVLETPVGFPADSLEIRF